jgi:hypothetical protein
MYICGLAEVLSFESANHKKDWIRKSLIRKVEKLQKVCKSSKFISPQICGTYLRTALLWGNVLTDSLCLLVLFFHCVTITNDV